MRIKNAFIMVNSELYKELLNHSILYLTLIEHCTLIILEFINKQINK